MPLDIPFSVEDALEIADNHAQIRNCNQRIQDIVNKYGPFPGGAQVSPIVTARGSWTGLRIPDPPRPAAEIAAVIDKAAVPMKKRKRGNGVSAGETI